MLDAATQLGVHIPTLCYYPRLPTHAVCRMCLVSVAGQSKPQSACKTKARQGDVSEFVAIEVMACVGGCLGAGGEPKSMDPQIL